MLGAGRYGGVTVPALPVRFVAGSASRTCPSAGVSRGLRGPGAGPETVSGFAGVLASRGAPIRVRGVRWCGRGVRPVGRRTGGFAAGVSARYRAERRLLLGFLLVETGDGATGGALAGGVPGYRRLRSPASSLRDRGHLDTLRPGEILRHPDPASVA